MKHINLQENKKLKFQFDLNYYENKLFRQKIEKSTFEVFKKSIEIRNLKNLNLS